METINNDQIERLLEDISSIKTVINRNKSLLHRIFNLVPFRWFLLVVGLSTIGFCMLIFFLTQHYGSFGSIPSTLRTSIYIALAVCAIVMQIWKGRAYLASVKKIDKRLTLGWAFKEFYSNKISYLYISVVVLMVFLSIFFIVKHIPYFIIPTFSIGVALICIGYGVILQISYSLIVGYWCFITGICTIIFSSIPAPIALSMTIGCCMLILSFQGFLSSRSSVEV